MPELPEVEITARLIAAEVAGAQVTAALAPGLNALRSFDPPLAALAGMTLTGIRRRGKLFLVDFAPAPAPVGARATDTGSPGGLTLLVHLMSAGRLQLYDRPAAARDRTTRIRLRLGDGARELRLREFGTQQRAWVKLLSSAALATEETLAALGPEAWPEPPTVPALRAALAQPRPLHGLLRDQHVIAGIGRAWADEILHAAQLSPFKRGSDLGLDELTALRDAIRTRLGGAIAHYERTLALPIPDRLPLPLHVHRHQGEPCPRCRTRLEAVFYEDYVIAYCPRCQTAGKLLKDRRLSRLLK